MAPPRPESAWPRVWLWALLAAVIVLVAIARPFCNGSAVPVPHRRWTPPLATNGRTRSAMSLDGKDSRADSRAGYLGIRIKSGVKPEERWASRPSSPDGNVQRQAFGSKLSTQTLSRISSRTQLEA